MKLLYGLFYTSFSLAVVSAFALVVVLLIRFIIVKVPKKYFMCLWWLFLIRSICPVSLSSIYSLSPGINRKFHIFLELIGLSFDEQGGVLTGWQSVFVRQFTVNTNFRFCSIMWAAGVLFIWIYTLVKQTGIRKWLQKAERLDGSIYQHEKLNIPVMTGVFRLKKYLPGKMNVSEAKYVLRHMEIHEERHDGVLRAAAFIVLSLQWFNPFMWLAHYFILRDIETAADEDTLSYFGYDDRAKYAQEILNMNKGKKVIRPSLVTFQENRIDDRASKMLYQNKIKNVNGRYYAFDGLGRMQTGFVLFDTRSTFVAQYDMDAWSSEDFIDGNIYGIEKADLYFFSPDELNDGSMQTGNELKIELEDGVYTFGFKSDGVAYGNRNRLKRVKDSYYINGLRLEADEEYGYGVVRENENSYRVVNTNGKTITGNKKVVKDKDGGWLIIINSRFAARVDDEFKPRWYKGEEGTGFYHYDSDNKEDRYEGGLIAGSHTEPLVDGLPEEERLNF